MGKRTGVLLVLMLLALHSLFAQSTTSNIEGWIFDTKNQPLVSANIVVTSFDLQGSRGTSTDERGYFRISSLPVGVYTVKISYISYQQVIINDVNLFLGHTTSLGEIHLRQSTMETQEVIVSAGKSIIDTRSAANSKSLTTRQAAQLPIERNYFHIAELLPHANISYKGDRGTNFAGSTGQERKMVF